jgi:nucleoside phosphorylase
VTHHPVDFLLLTALEEELRCLLDHLPGAQKQDPTAEDNQTYYKAAIPAMLPSATPILYNVVASGIMAMGRVKAAAFTAVAIQKWRPRFVILIGIAGGVPESGVSLGDVLVSDQIVDYELQKQQAPHDLIRYEVHRTDPRLLGAAMNFSDSSWISKTAPRPVAGTPRRWVGPIATGDKVVARKGLIDRYRRDWPKLIGVEMEAGGVATSVYQASSKPGFFMVRGVSDLADEKKDSAPVSDWRGYACSVAATYTVALLRSGPVPPAGQPTPADRNLEIAVKHTLDVDLSTEEVRRKIQTDISGRKPEGIFGEGGLCLEYPLTSRPDNCFLAADVAGSDDLNEALSTALRDFAITPIKATDLIVPGAALCKIAGLIRETRFGIYELAEAPDLNVYLQLGMAIGLGRPFLLLKHRESVPSRLASALDYYPVDSYLELRFGLQHHVRDIILNMSRYRPLIHKSDVTAGVFVEHGDIDCVDFAYAVTKSLNSENFRPTFRSVDEAALKILENENLDFDVMEETVSNPLQQMIAAISASQLAIIRIDDGASPDAALTLGVALAQNRPAILIHRAKSSIPSNLIGLNRMSFATFSELGTRLARTLRHFLQHS